MLQRCRKRANYEARKYLSTREEKSSPSPPVHSFACGFVQRVRSGEEQDVADTSAPMESSQGNPFLTPEEESLLVAFYAAKLPSLIGPLAQNPYLRRDIKVTATSALLFRRFFLSNSVMVHDPKAMMVAAAFLASKVEDAMTEVRHLEEGTKLMNSPVSQSEILQCEFALLEGIHCDLLCFHPYKAVLAFTEDLRMFIKSDKGRELARFKRGENRPVVGQDLKPMHDGARRLVDDVIVSDIPLMYSPGHAGLTALMVANDDLENPEVPKIDLFGYVQHRFEGKNHGYINQQVKEIFLLLKGLKDGKHGCGNHNVDLAKLKGVHKKLKKCRGGDKRKKKRKNTEGGEETHESKKPKT
mmetsp:Transcript_44/g.98  ORF Transcript_44/g.98 Transcript_44/m.98 type:complete len:356 (+) Transcript_44:3-1070(+)